MTGLEALVSLNMAGEIGSVRLARLLGYFDKPDDIFRASPEKLTRIAGISANIANRVHSFKPESLNKELETARKLNLEIITLDSPDYPENLKNIFSPPIVLYVKGALLKEDKFSVAIVGSRHASFYGLSSAEKFGRELAGLNLTVTSGMARGIDTSAHKGALKAGGRTIAVIGSGFCRIYPEENKGLAEKIAQNGAVISEFPVNALPLKENFPRRNRIISGLSLGTLVVEAARNSGALITADFALEQGREVFVIPGKIDSENSYGANELIKQGARLVTSKEDILEGLYLPLAEKTVKKEKSFTAPENEAGRLYGLISDEPLYFDEIIEKTNLGVQEISLELLRLQIKKLIRQLPGKQYVRSHYARN